MVASAAMQRLLLIATVSLASVSFAAGCGGQSTKTVSRCYPEGADCSGLEAPLQAAGETSMDPERGRRGFLDRCSPCHGPDGKGMGFAKRGDFTRPEWQRKLSDEQILEVVRKGRGMQMPAFSLPAPEILAIVAHVRSLGPKPPKPAAKKGY